MYNACRIQVLTRKILDFIKHPFLTKGEINEFILKDEEPQVVRIPGFYWHGTKCLDAKGSLVVYFMSNLYDYKNPDEERMVYNKTILYPRTNKLYEW